MPKIKVIFDSNIWISFAMGGTLDILKEVLNIGAIESWICEEIAAEFNDVVTRPKVQKYLDSKRVVDTLLLMSTFSKHHSILSQVKVYNDEKDNFLLAFASEIQADYIVSGDKGVQSILEYKNTKIINFSAFMDVLRTSGLI